jgi:hypothetical protein
LTDLAVLFSECVLLLWFDWFALYPLHPVASSTSWGQFLLVIVAIHPAATYSTQDQATPDQSEIDQWNKEKRLYEKIHVSKYY